MAARAFNTVIVDDTSDSNGPHRTLTSTQFPVWAWSAPVTYTKHLGARIQLGSGVKSIHIASNTATTTANHRQRPRLWTLTF